MNQGLATLLEQNLKLKKKLFLRCSECKKLAYYVTYTSVKCSRSYNLVNYHELNDPIRLLPLKCFNIKKVKSLNDLIIFDLLLDGSLTKKTSLMNQPLKTGLVASLHKVGIDSNGLALYSKDQILVSWSSRPNPEDQVIITITTL